MISEEEIHRYHMIERVYGPPLPINDTHDGSTNEASSSKIQSKRDKPESTRIVLSISPPSSPRAREERGIGGSTSYLTGNVMGLAGGSSTVLVPKKSKKRKSPVPVTENANGNASINSPQNVDGDGDIMEKEKGKKDKKSKKDEIEKIAEDIHTAKGKVNKKGKGKGKDRASVLPSTSVPSLIPTKDLETTPKAGEVKKQKKQRVSKVMNADVEAESSTPKTKKQKKNKTKTLSILTPLPGSSTSTSSSTPGMGVGYNELDSDEADIFEIDELLPSSPVLPSPHLPSSQNAPPPQMEDQVISQSTPTPKPRKKKRVSDSSGFDTPSAPSHLRHPLSNSITTTEIGHANGGGDGTPSRLGRIGGTPIKKALVRLGASWVTSTPVPK